MLACMLTLCHQYRVCWVSIIPHWIFGPLWVHASYTALFFTQCECNLHSHWVSFETRLQSSEHHKVKSSLGCKTGQNSANSGLNQLMYQWHLNCMRLEQCCVAVLCFSRHKLWPLVCLWIVFYVSQILSVAVFWSGREKSVDIKIKH